MKHIKHPLLHLRCFLDSASLNQKQMAVPICHQGVGWVWSSHHPWWRYEEQASLATSPGLRHRDATPRTSAVDGGRHAITRGIFMWHARFDITCEPWVEGYNHAIWVGRLKGCREGNSSPYPGQLCQFGCLTGSTVEGGLINMASFAPPYQAPQGLRMQTCKACLGDWGCLS